MNERILLFWDDRRANSTNMKVNTTTSEVNCYGTRTCATNNKTKTYLRAPHSMSWENVHMLHRCHVLPALHFLHLRRKHQYSLVANVMQQWYPSVHNWPEILNTGRYSHLRNLMRCKIKEKRNIFIKIKLLLIIFFCSRRIEQFISYNQNKSF